MSTYTPASFPRRPKLPTLAGSLRYQAQLAYYRYEINTGLYVMSPGEKLALNLINLFVATLMLSALYYCTPAVLSAPIRRLALQVGGNLGGGSVQKVQTYEAILNARAAGEAVASLSHGGMAGNGSVAFPSGF